MQDRVVEQHQLILRFVEIQTGVELLCDIFVSNLYLKLVKREVDHGFAGNECQECN